MPVYGQAPPPQAAEIPRGADQQHVPGKIWLPPPQVDMAQWRIEPADRRPVGRPAGERDIQLSLSTRFTAAGKPRFVLGFRAVEEGDPETRSLEIPNEIVKYFETIANQEIQKVDQLYQLDERQKSKLRLAAMGDMSRLVRELRELQEECCCIPARDQQKTFVIANALNGLNRHLNEGVLREGSMFGRVLANILSSLPASAAAKNKFGEQIEQWQLNLDDHQQTRLERLLIVQSQRLVDPEIPWESDQTIALVLSLDRDELEKFLDATQLKSIDRLRWMPSHLQFRQD